MAAFMGKITETFSEPINGAPVVVTIETETGIETVVFQRQYWNDFFYAHQDWINDPDFRVTVEGEPHQQTIRCDDDDCCPDPGDWRPESEEPPDPEEEAPPDRAVSRTECALCGLNQTEPEACEGCVHAGTA